MSNFTLGVGIAPVKDCLRDKEYIGGFQNRTTEGKLGAFDWVLRAKTASTANDLNTKDPICQRPN